MKNTVAQDNYQETTLARGKGERIEIGHFKGSITRFYEEYPGMGGHTIHGYDGYDAHLTIKQLESFGWKVL